MKKTLLVAIGLMCGLSFIFSQPPRFGFDIGFSLNRATYEPVAGLERRIFGGFDGGFLVEFSLGSKFKLQPELNYTITGVELNTGTSERTLKLQYISIPLLVKMQITDRFNLVAGPQHGILLSAWNDPSGLLASNVKQYFKFTDLVAVLGGEYKFPNGVFFGARYNHGMEQIVEEQMGFEMKNRYVTARVGYIFGPPSKK